MIGSNSGRSPSGRATHEPSQSTLSRPSVGVPNADDDLPTVVSQGSVKIGNIVITVLNLSNGERVIDEQSVHHLLSAIFDDDAEAAAPTGDVS